MDDTTGMLIDELTGELYENPYGWETYDWWDHELKNFDHLVILERDLEKVLKTGASARKVIPQIRKIAQFHAKGIFTKIFCGLVKRYGIDKIYVDRDLRNVIKRLVEIFEKSNKSIGFLLHKNFILNCEPRRLIPGVLTRDEGERLAVLEVKYRKLMNEILSELYSDVHRIPGLIPDTRTLVSQYLTNRGFEANREVPEEKTLKKIPKKSR